MRIQHNIAAMNSYRNYSNNVSAVNKNLEKLSSGYKINRAGDDAAGLAISEKMRAQISGLEAASKNAKDGTSLVKTAEGALTEVHDMLNRMVTLAQQSANGTYDNETDRAQLQKELNQLRTEIDRIADSSNFNGINLLDGSMSADGVVATYNDVALTPVRDAKNGQAAAKGQFEVDMSQSKWVAANDGASVSFGLAGVGTDATVTLANKGDAVTGATLAQAWIDANTDADTGLCEVEVDGKTFKVTQEDGVLTFRGKDTSPFDTSKNGIAAGTSITVTAAGTNTVYYYDNAQDAGNQGFSQAWTMVEEPVSDTGDLMGQASFVLGGDDGVAISDGTTLRIGNETYTFAVGKNSMFKGNDNVINLTDYEAGADGLAVAAAARLTQAARTNSAVFVNYNADNGTIYLTEKKGGIDRDVYDLFGADTSAATGEADATWSSTERGFVQVGQASPAGKALTLQIGDTSDSYNQLKVNIKDCHTDAIGIGSINIGTQAGAAAAVDAIKSAINYVSDVRGTLGATQNRLEHTQNNLSVMKENIQDAESTIRDTDVAEEMMAYTKNNILVQSAQAMLAQANQIPQGVLQLLG